MIPHPSFRSWRGLILNYVADGAIWPVFLRGGIFNGLYSVEICGDGRWWLLLRPLWGSMSTMVVEGEQARLYLFVVLDFATLRNEKIWPPYREWTTKKGAFFLFCSCKCFHVEHLLLLVLANHNAFFKLVQTALWLWCALWSWRTIMHLYCIMVRSKRITTLRTLFDFIFS